MFFHRVPFTTRYGVSLVVLNQMSCWEELLGILCSALIVASADIRIM